MTRVAIAGYGFMGRTHYGAWRKCRGAKVVAICDNNFAQLNTKVVGNIKGAADNSKLPQTIKIYSSFDEMLSAGGFEVVDITLPTPLHAQMSIKALTSGYHVLCEKPMALTLDECDQMIMVARQMRRVLLVAQCVRFSPEYAYVRKLVKSNRYGKVIAADLTRFMSLPKWTPKKTPWLIDETKSGGLYVDAHIHDADYILSLFGAPDCVRSRCHISSRGIVDHLTSEYIYRDQKIVTSDCSFAAADSLTWDAALRIFLERATIYLGLAYQKVLTIYPMGHKPFSPRLSKATGYEEEVRYFLTLVKNPAPYIRSLSSRSSQANSSFLLTARDAREALALVLKERKCARHPHQ